MPLAPRNVVLLLLVLALLALDLSTGGVGGPPARAVGPLFPDLRAEDVQRLVIESPAPDGGRNRVELVRTGDALRPWRVPAAFDHPTWDGAVDELLQVVVALSTIDLLTEDASQHARYGVDGSGARLVLSGAGETVLADLVQGDTAPGGRATYVRRFGEDAVYRMARLRRLRADVNGLLDTRWMPHEPALVQTIRLSGADVGEELVLARDPQLLRRWTSHGEELPSLAVGGLLTRLAGLHFEEVLAAGDAPLSGLRLQVELSLSSGVTWVGRFGAALDDGRVPATGSGWTVAFPLEAYELVRDAARAAGGWR
jgi:hypothetical protein